ncbi:hypothetical protein SapgrDRAFT_2691 [Saprospira grandis DSM 2844]|uniref:DUF7793 domain-containing protein n=1 Tax=Saprospira grandis DSM 2844 TaxID=694433 RepID=J0P9R8_9BACT|nr:STAS/SEC14 domain-containing protein [Saprospira grandis]EJF54347.1 hypothetical protein SapgrDRAFT_2691 [Saprospira grandis DSM 2844]
MAKKIDEFGQLEYWLLDNGILEIRTVGDKNKSKEISLEEIVYGVEVQQRLLEEEQQKIILLAEMSSMSKLSKSAKDFLKTEEGRKLNDFTLANALLVSNAFSRMLGNMLVGVVKSDYPVRIFSNREEAIKWLLSFK